MQQLLGTIKSPWQHLSKHSTTQPSTLLQSPAASYLSHIGNSPSWKTVSLSSDKGRPVNIYHQWKSRTDQDLFLLGFCWHPPSSLYWTFPVGSPVTSSSGFSLLDISCGSFIPVVLAWNFLWSLSAPSSSILLGIFPASCAPFGLTIS